MPLFVNETPILTESKKPISSAGRHERINCISRGSTLWGQLLLLRSPSGPRVSVLDSKQKSEGFSCCLYSRGTRNSSVSVRRELTVSLVLISISLPISQTASLDRSKKKSKQFHTPHSPHLKYHVVHRGLFTVNPLLSPPGGFFF